MTNASETPAAMIVIVGPSGAGKDSLMAFAADRLGDRPDIGFVRRVITRPADAGGEAHHAASDDAFAAMAAARQFAEAVPFVTGGAVTGWTVRTWSGRG